MRKVREETYTHELLHLALLQALLELTRLGGIQSKATVTV